MCPWRFSRRFRGRSPPLSSGWMDSVRVTRSRFSLLGVAEYGESDDSKMLHSSTPVTRHLAYWSHMTIRPGVDPAEGRMIILDRVHLTGRLTFHPQEQPEHLIGSSGFSLAVCFYINRERFTTSLGSCCGLASTYNRLRVWQTRLPSSKCYWLTHKVPLTG